MHSSCGRLLRLEIIFLFCLFCTEIHTSRASVVLCVCVCVCVHQLTLTLKIRISYLRIGGVGGWVFGNTNVLRTENNTLYLRTAPKDNQKFSSDACYRRVVGRSSEVKRRRQKQGMCEGVGG